MAIYPKLKELKIFENAFFEFDKGWIDLVYKMGADIMKICDDNNYPYPRFLQMKEKMGGFNYYCEISKDNLVLRDRIYDVIREAEKRSWSICEKCGESGSLRDTGGRYDVACDARAGKNSVLVEWNP